MARIEDIPQPTRDAILALACPEPARKPWVTPRPLRECRVALLTSAALHSRDEPPFAAGSAEVRLLPATMPAAAMAMTHVSINFDRIGFARDVNVVYPIDRLREMAARGAIAAAADTHFSVMGATDPAAMGATADAIAGRLKQEAADAVLLCPV